MYIQVKNISKHSWYSNLNGWVLEVENETITSLMGYKCAPRYVATQEQRKKLVAIFGVPAVPQIVCIMVNEASPIEVEPEEVDEHNFATALNNLARQHGYELLGAVDWRKLNV